MVGGIGPLSYRQYLAWQWWLDEQWNHPKPTEHYLMALCCEVHRILQDLRADRRGCSPDDFRIKFTIRRRPLTAQEKAAKQKEGAAASRARWAGIMAVAARAKKPPPPPRKPPKQ